MQFFDSRPKGVDSTLPFHNFQVYTISNELEAGDRTLCFYDVGITLSFPSGHYLGFREFSMTSKTPTPKKGNNQNISCVSNLDIELGGSTMISFSHQFNQYS